MPQYTLEDENRCVSNFSPGVVGNREELLRILFNPEHIGKDNGILPSAVPTSDLIKDGLSVYRRNHAVKEDVLANVNSQMSKVPGSREGFGLCVFPCSTIRGFQDDGQRCFLVVDEALEDNISHAAIYSVAGKTKSQLRKLRTDMLYPLMQQRYSIDDIFTP
jgi:hypothetical protein